MQASEVASSMICKAGTMTALLLTPQLYPGVIWRANQIALSSPPEHEFQALHAWTSRQMPLVSGMLWTPTNSNFQHSQTPWRRPVPPLKFPQQPFSPLVSANSHTHKFWQWILATHSHMLVLPRAQLHETFFTDDCDRSTYSPRCHFNCKVTEFTVNWCGRIGAG